MPPTLPASRAGTEVQGRAGCAWSAWSALRLWAAVAALWPAPALAQASAVSPAGSALHTLLLIAAFSLLPFVLLTTTSFVKLSIVLGVLRNAFGVTQLPSGAVVTALAAILTLYVMSPVAAAIAQAAAEPASRIDLEQPLRGESRRAVVETFERGREPLRAFLLRNSGERERTLFRDLARRARPDAAEAINERDLNVVLPAFLITELSEAFQIGFFVLLPFLVLELVLASILSALGMTALSPSTVSLPFKLLLFVLVDGWYVLSEALVSGYF